MDLCPVALGPVALGPVALEPRSLGPGALGPGASGPAPKDVARCTLHVAGGGASAYGAAVHVFFKNKNV